MPGDGPSYGEQFEQEGDPEEPIPDLTRPDVEGMIAEAIKKERERTAAAIRKVAKHCAKPGKHMTGELEHILYEIADQL